MLLNTNLIRQNWRTYRSQRNSVFALRCKSIIHHFDQLCASCAGNPRDFIVLIEKERVIKEQSQVAEIFDEYFTNITKDLIVHKQTTLRDQAHVNGIPWRVSERQILLVCGELTIML